MSDHRDDLWALIGEWVAAERRAAELGVRAEFHVRLHQHPAPVERTGPAPLPAGWTGGHWMEGAEEASAARPGRRPSGRRASQASVRQRVLQVCQGEWRRPEEIQRLVAALGPSNRKTVRAAMYALAAEGALDRWEGQYRSGSGRSPASPSTSSGAAPTANSPSPATTPATPTA